MNDHPGDIYVMQQIYHFYSPLTDKVNVIAFPGEILILLEPNVTVTGTYSSWNVSLLLTSHGELIHCGHSGKLWNSSWNSIMTLERKKS